MTCLEGNARGLEGERARDDAGDLCAILISSWIYLDICQAWVIWGACDGPAISKEAMAKQREG